MSKSIGAALCSALLLLVPFGASAQSRTATPPDPLDAKVSVPPLRYSSAFAGYKPLAEVPVASWRAANDEVTRIGGWRVYLRESQPGETAPQGHGGHSGHKTK